MLKLKYRIKKQEFKTIELDNFGICGLHFSSRRK